MDSWGNKKVLLRIRKQIKKKNVMKKSLSLIQDYTLTRLSMKFV